MCNTTPLPRITRITIFSITCTPTVIYSSRLFTYLVTSYCFDKTSARERSLKLYILFAGWGNGNLKPQVLMEQNLNQSEVSYVESSHSQSVSHAPPPKLEDFLGHSSAVMRYSDSQTETQDSSLTHMYDHHSSAFFGDQQDLKAIAGFQAFSTNSGSEVDDSASIGKAQPSEFGTHSIESSGNEFATFSGGATGNLSLAVAQSSEKAVSAADSGSSKKVVDTFGQRTSIYRGVTRYTDFSFLYYCYCISQLLFYVFFCWFVCVDMVLGLKK